MKIPLISVIIPCYNAERTIINTYMSIEDNGFYEIICIDDCSEDHTRDVLEDILGTESKNSIKLIYNEHNLGPGLTRNKGLEIASGKYVMFLDSDDELMEGFTNAVKDKLKEEPDCLMFDMVFRKYGKDSYLKMFFSPRIHEGRVSSKNALIYGRGCICGKLYSRELFDRSGVQFSSSIMGEDVIFFKSVINKAETIYYLATPLYRYNFVATSIVGSKEHYSYKLALKTFKEIKMNIGDDKWSPEINTLFFFLIIYLSTVTCIRVGLDTQACKEHFKKVLKYYRKPDKYFAGYDLRFKLVYLMFRLNMFDLVRVLLRKYEKG